MCAENGIEMRPDFAVIVTHGGKPFRGVNVWVSANAEANAIRSFSGVTDTRGRVQVSSLPPGNYWLTAELLGVIAGMQCFHIASHSTRKAKKGISYSWGDLVPATRQVAGRLIESRPGKTDNPLWNLTHRINVPVREAALKIQSPFTGDVFVGTTDAGGRFSFHDVPQGTYVLHIEGGIAEEGHDWEPTDLLIALRDTAQKGALLLTRRDASGGSCGGTYLDLLVHTD